MATVAFRDFSNRSSLDFGAFTTSAHENRMASTARDFGASAGTGAAKRTSKSGSIVTEEVDGRLVAARRDGRFWMYWGEGVCSAATSDDLIRWEPVTFDASADRYLTHDPGAGGAGWGLERVPGSPVLRPMLFPRRGRFDSLLVEPGPQLLEACLLVFEVVESVVELHCREIRACMTGSE